MAEEEKVYVSNATNPLKKVMMCSPRYYQFNGINVITAEWMKKGDQEKNDVMVAEWQMLVDAFKDNGIEVVEVEARPEFEVMTFARDYGCMIKEGAVIGHFRHPICQVEAVAYEEKLKEMGVPIGARERGLHGRRRLLDDRRAHAGVRPGGSYRPSRRG